MKLRVRRFESIAEDVESARQRVTARAHELFRARGGGWGRALEDWLAAEREVAWRPAAELSERDGVMILELATAGVDGKDLDIRVTADDVVVSAPALHDHADAGETVHLCEFKRGGLFRAVHLPRPVDPTAARAEYQNGLLRLTIPLAPATAQRVVVGAAVPVPEHVDPQC